MTSAAQAKPTTTTAVSGQKSWAGLITGLVLVAVLTLLVAEFDQLIANFFKSQGVAQNPLEYPLTAVVIGLIANAVLKLTKLYDFVRPAIRTELYLKIGLVLLGANIALGDLVKKGAGGLIQAVIMVTCVFFFTWWLGGKLKLSDTLRAVMSTAVSICGVSAAIAAAGAVLAKKEEVTYITTLVIIVALPMMVILPPIAQALSLPQDVAGAWFGGNIDTTAAVVGSGTVYAGMAGVPAPGENELDAQQTASVVKLSQNVLIGFAAFALALYFSTVVQRGEGDKRPSLQVIWQRFPKFVIGFVLVSILASIGIFSAGAIAEMKQVYKWAFALAFVCIGLELSPGKLRGMGWKPVAVYAAATVFNTVLALIVASIIFGTLGL